MTNPGKPDSRRFILRADGSLPHSVKRLSHTACSLTVSFSSQLREQEFSCVFIQKGGLCLPISDGKKKEKLKLFKVCFSDLYSQSVNVAIYFS